MNKTVVADFNNTSLRLSLSRINKILDAPDKKSALQMSFAKRIQYIVMNKEKKLSDLYDYMHTGTKAEKLLIRPNDGIDNKLILDLNEKITNFQIEKMCKIRSAEKIKRYYIEHKENLRNKNNPKQEFTTMVYNGKRKEKDINGVMKEIKGRVYYLSKNHPPCHKPTTRCETNNNEAGAYKHVTHKDDMFVALAPNKGKFNTVNNFNDLKGLNRIKFGLAVASDMIISRNAGRCVKDCINSNTIIPQLAFKNAVDDLKQLHERRVYLRDIKPGNTAFDGKHINFIDVDDRIGVNKETATLEPIFNKYGKEASYTRKYITQKLFDKIYRCNPSSDNKITLRPTYSINHPLKVADEYAFLMTMIAATSNDTDLKSSIADAKIDIIGNSIMSGINKELEQYNVIEKQGELIDRFVQTKKEYCHPGVMNTDNEKHFIPWLNDNIKPKNIKSVKLLLTDPAGYAEEKFKTHLADMLLFKSPTNTSIPL
ncbi:MAG: hypothetical protein ACRCUG_07550 [Yersinia sp. (in: enterobacteria)]